MARSLAVIIDYESGNLHSAAKAFQKVGAPLDVDIRVTAKPDDVARADHVVLPGVGAFGDCAAGLRAVDGMVEALERRVLAQGRPFLGICVGAQLMAVRGLERGAHDGLGWLRGDVVEIAPTNPALKVPHMGWNELVIRAAHPALSDLGAAPQVYFVHSFHARLDDAEQILATADHGGPISAVIGRDNLIGTQFHPEKSQAAGQKLIENFLRWRP